LAAKPLTSRKIPFPTDLAKLEMAGERQASN
jgi:hypothetical protein